MVEVERLYLDTNIFIRLFEGADELSQKLTELLISGTAGQSPFRVTSELTVAELVVAPFRSHDDRMLRLYRNWTQTNSYLEVVPVEYSNLWHAGVLRATYLGLKLPDAIHVSTAIGARCSHILTADQRISDDYRLDYEWDGHRIGPRKIEVLRPDVPTIEMLIEQVSR
ncbi:type II toxin-antitoxin system VapC family toxin [Microbaculum marinisediminis]|uniref:PIN domain-containing protein n=1 Tax=Microbaculum marinisediminis TaxID=2931392 RepID=A0AAW5QWL0_9HYPH|nr:PIN domain-containing protein [Microbaculum sp. A6E488]MCT8970846.1 PIN domain-containing protein [Microbaculum sp. A6E488]